MVSQEGHEGRQRPPEEALLDPLDVSSRCLDQVQRGLSEIKNRMTTDKPLDYDGGTVGRIALDIAKNAAETGDVAAVETQIDLLLRLPGAYKADLAEACFAGIRGGQSARI